MTWGMVIRCGKRSDHTRIAQRVSSALNRRIELNPTLVHHGLAKAARWHVVTANKQVPIADLYRMTSREAARVAEELATVIRVPVLLLSNRGAPARLDDHVIVRSAGGHLTHGPRHNPSRRPVAGETWKHTITGVKCKVLRVSGNRIEYLESGTGRRLYETVGEFLATHKAPSDAPRLNPGGRNSSSNVRALVNELKLTANLYHKSKISHRDLGERNRRVYDQATMLGVYDEVVAAISKWKPNPSRSLRARIARSYRGLERSSKQRRVQARYRAGRASAAQLRHEVERHDVRRILRTGSSQARPYPSAQPRGYGVRGRGPARNPKGRNWITEMAEYHRSMGREEFVEKMLEVMPAVGTLRTELRIAAGKAWDREHAAEGRKMAAERRAALTAFDKEFLNPGGRITSVEKVARGVAAGWRELASKSAKDMAQVEKVVRSIEQKGAQPEYMRAVEIYRRAPNPRGRKTGAQIRASRVLPPAFFDGHKAGAADRLIGQRSDYAWFGVNDPNPYTASYALGYRAGWNGEPAHGRNPNPRGRKAISVADLDRLPVGATIEYDGRTLAIGKPRKRIPGRKRRIGGRRPRKGPRKAHARRNPRSPVEAAKAVYAMWQDRNVSPRVKRVRHQMRVPKAVASLGKLAGVIYDSDKFDGKKKRYEHRFKRPLPELTAGPDGRLHIVGGGYKTTSDGLVN